MAANQHIDSPTPEMTENRSTEETPMKELSGIKRSDSFDEFDTY